MSTWDFSRKLASAMVVCRRGHRRESHVTRCPACDRVREVKAWRELKDDPAALAAYNEQAALRKAKRKQSRST